MINNIDELVWDNDLLNQVINTELNLPINRIRRTDEDDIQIAGIGHNDGIELIIDSNDGKILSLYGDRIPTLVWILLDHQNNLCEVKGVFPEKYKSIIDELKEHCINPKIVFSIVKGM